jgi:MOSC domain-containing protein YiiM
VPCGNLNKWYPELLKAIEGRSGWVAKVVVEGDVKPGDAIERVDR